MTIAVVALALVTRAQTPAYDLVIRNGRIVDVQRLDQSGQDAPLEKDASLSPAGDRFDDEPARVVNEPARRCLEAHATDVQWLRESHLDPFIAGLTRPREPPRLDIPVERQRQPPLQM